MRSPQRGQLSSPSPRPPRSITSLGAGSLASFFRYIIESVATCRLLPGRAGLRRDIRHLIGRISVLTMAMTLASRGHIAHESVRSRAQPRQERGLCVRTRSRMRVKTRNFSSIHKKISAPALLSWRTSLLGTYQLSFSSLTAWANLRRCILIVREGFVSRLLRRIIRGCPGPPHLRLEGRCMIHPFQFTSERQETEGANAHLVLYVRLNFPGIRLRICVSF